jgi:hypothetical protein
MRRAARRKLERLTPRLYLAVMDVFMSWPPSVRTEHVSARFEARRCSVGSGRVRSLIPLWETEPVEEPKARTRFRSLQARTADRFEIVFTRPGGGEHV